MTLGEKLIRLRALEGHARGLGRELTQSEVSAGIRAMGGAISQSYLSQLESGARPHMTGNSRSLLARFFKVHPGYLVDDPEEAHLRLKPRRDVDERVDAWLIEGSEEFRGDPALHRALLEIAKHDQSRECLVLLGSLAANPALIDRLVESLTPPPPSRKRRNGSA